LLLASNGPTSLKLGTERLSSWSYWHCSAQHGAPVSVRLAHVEWDLSIQERYPECCID
jgi:hypothetical protein